MYTVVVYLGKKLFAKGHIYISLRRLQYLEVLWIEKQDCNKLRGMIPCNENTIQESDIMQKVQNVNKQTNQSHSF
jgi:hypothetical protein